MSGNAEAKKPKAPAKGRTDRRITRTRDTLGDALVQLMHEKSFDDITVQQVLDRAGVSRSTFYTHYRDKNDLFLSDVEDFFELMAVFLDKRNAPLSRVVPVAELFAHVADMRAFYRALIESGKVNDLRELGIGSFARSIEKRLLLAGVKMEAALLRATSQAYAGSLFTLLDWWLLQEKPMSPLAMDALFHRMVWDGIRSPQ